MKVEIDWPNDKQRAFEMCEGLAKIKGVQVGQVIADLIIAELEGYPGNALIEQDWEDGLETLGIKKK